VTAAGTDSTAVLDGFTIRGGHAFGSKSPDEFSRGGGIRIDTASPVIRNCLIESNAAGYYGGGIYCTGVCTPLFIECVIADNWSYWRGGGMYKDWGSRVTMERCLISGNSTVYDGGGIANHTDGELTLSNCILSGNMAIGVDSGRGGAIYCSLATVHLNHCTFVGNSATWGAGLACASAATPGGSFVDIRNCILWDRGASLWTSDGSTVNVAYSDVQGGWPGVGNRDVDPRFVDPGHWDEKETPEEPADDIWFDGDYRLAWDSPCVDAGDPLEVPGAAEKDFAGRPRRSGVAVDMGAYELRNEPPIADAGPNVAGFSLDGVSGSVTLDANRSLDPEGQPLTYRWYREGQLVSSLVRFTTVLPIGDHTFTLIVHDGLRDSAPDEVLASISPIIPTTAMISPGEMDRSRTDPSIIALVVLPAGKRAADFDMAQPMLLFPGGIEATTQTFLVWLNGKVYTMAKFDRAKLMEAVPTNGTVELRVVGALKDGRYFSGADTVKIK
jgi:predicted outer membrane repeat protein